MNDRIEPPGYVGKRAHPRRHSSEEFRRIADSGTILRTVVGSTVHGLSVSDQDDRDEMGICIEPPEYVTGLLNFEQYEHRTAWERGANARSGPGDLDLVVYGLRKWMRLACAGNPTVLLPLFAPEDSFVTITQMGYNLRKLKHAILSVNAGERFLGYLRAQRKRLDEKNRGKGWRPELIEQFGFDTKFAGHMVRLGLQGYELLKTGTITLPVPEPERSWIVALRKGEISKEEALASASALEALIENRLRTGTSALPPKPDYDTVNEWLQYAYQEHWRY